jgi:hydrogenase maturation protease
MADTRNILILGVGNILYTDEGLGVRVVEELQQEFDFPDTIELMDGGTLGAKLMGPMMERDQLIVVDAVLQDGQPGDIYRLEGEDLRASLAFKNSLHDSDLLDTLMQCEIIGHRPEAVVIGVEPEDYHSLAIDVTPAIRARFPEIKAKVLEELVRQGGSYTAKS